MEKLLIFRNDRAISFFDEVTRENLPILQNVINEYNKLKTGNQLIINKLITLEAKVRATQGATSSHVMFEDFIRDEIVANKSTSIAGITIASEQLKKIIQVPEITAFGEAVILLSNSVNGNGTGIALGSFDIVNGKAAVNEKEREYWISSNTHYANTPGEIKFTKIVKELCAALNKHHKAMKLEMRDAIPDPPRGIKVEDNEYKPDVYRIRQYGSSF